MVGIIENLGGSQAGSSCLLGVVLLHLGALLEWGRVTALGACAIVLLQDLWGMLSALSKSAHALRTLLWESTTLSLVNVYVARWLLSTVSSYPKKPVTIYIWFSKEQLPIFKAQM